MRYARMIALSLLIAVSLAFPYSFSAWTSMTGAKTFAITPFFYFAPVGSATEDMDINADAVVGYGFTDKIDMFVNIATVNLKSDPGAYSTTWIMPRYDLGGNNIVAAQIGLEQDADNNLQVYGGPHYHFFWENDRCAMEFNALALFHADSTAPTTASIYAAPVYKLLPNLLYPFVEVDPTYTFGDGGGLDFVLAPGLWIGIPGTPHQFSISVPISGIKDGSVSTGIYAWYWVSFSLGGGK
jgi:hypothetical protein